VGAGVRSLRLELPEIGYSKIRYVTVITNSGTKLGT